MILKDRIRLSYPWIKIKNETEELLCKLSLAEDSKESELFLYRLYSDGEGDLALFTKKEKEEIKALLALLIEDAERHKKLLAKMAKEIKVMHEEAEYEP